jgi:hypothetical protein
MVANREHGEAVGPEVAHRPGALLGRRALDAGVDAVEHDRLIVHEADDQPV